MVKTKVSILDLGPVRKEQSMREAIDDMVRLAKAAEKMGYDRYWIAEHHNTPSVVSSATVVLIKHILDQTKTIRVGSGGIMLPNHSSLIVAEQFGTLAQLHPNRIDLGVGRAPGTDPLTAHALRGSSSEERIQAFPTDIKALLRYFSEQELQEYVKAPVAIGTYVPIYILGSSLYSASLAAKLGLPYAFAAHFAPANFEEAISLYRQEFQPSNYCQKPYVIACINVIASESDRDAYRELSTLQQFFLNVVRGVHNPLLPPVDSMDGRWTLAEKNIVQSMLRYSFIGSKDSIRRQWGRFQKQFSIDELMAVTYIYEQEKQIYSYELLKEVMDEG